MTGAGFILLTENGKLGTFLDVKVELEMICYKY
jgi:hypothetical protein